MVKTVNENIFDPNNLDIVKPKFTKRLKDKWFITDLIYNNTDIVYPPKELVFRVFEMNVQDIKIVLLGHCFLNFFLIALEIFSIITFLEELNIPKEYIDTEISRLKKVLQEKYKLYRGNHEPIVIKGKNIIVVDDGIATGNTLLACIAMLRKKNTLKITHSYINIS